MEPECGNRKYWLNKEKYIFWQEGKEFQKSIGKILESTEDRGEKEKKEIWVKQERNEKGNLDKGNNGNLWAKRKQGLRENNEYSRENRDSWHYMENREIRKYVQEIYRKYMIYVINGKQGNFGNGNREIKEYGENGKTFKT